MGGNSGFGTSNPMMDMRGQAPQLLPYKATPTPPMKPGMPTMPPQAGPAQGAMDPNMLQFFSQFKRADGGQGVR